ncbi:MAG: 6-phosphogluconolactonase [Actinobacteria bacterium]|nr:6-phosphogluconolactonase [Actinomycetota bacterium]
MNEVELVVLDDADAVAAAVADALAQAARGGGHIALTGGRTPELAYKEVAKLEPDWSKVELWWSDERCVPPGDDLSNYALAKRTLLDNLGSAPRHVHRIKGELGKERAADDYERELGETVFDLELLGVGPDGHVASLFPNAPTLQQQQRVLPAEPGLDPFVDRVTLSIPALKSARVIVFALAGAEKADAARRAFAEEPSLQAPASLVRATNGRTTAILDRAAAAKLSA